MSQRETNACLRDPITVRSTSSGLSICYYCSFCVFWIIFYPSPPIIKLSFSIWLSAYLFSAQLWNILEICYSHLLSPLSQDQIPFDPHQCSMRWRHRADKSIGEVFVNELFQYFVTNFIRSYLHHFFDDFHSLKASLKFLKKPFDWCQSRLEAINIGRDIKQINW